MRIIAVIPARYASTRFVGKPLCDIEGRPMIWWVYHACCQVEEFADVIVATDDERIFSVCQRLDMNVRMTSATHKTGTDRLCEVAREVPADLFVNVQGDEPLLEPNVIRSVIPPFHEDNNLQVCNLMTKIDDPCEVVNNTVPKVIVNREGFGVYLTRAAAPYPKGALDVAYYKQVCVYGFTNEALRFFSDYATLHGKARNEEIEDIEILRFIESGIKVRYVEVKTSSIAVDTEKDLEKVRRIVRAGTGNCSVPGNT